MNHPQSSITILFFGACREAVGESEIAFLLKDQAADNELLSEQVSKTEDTAQPVSSVFQKLKTIYPQLAGFERSILFAVNESHVRSDFVVRAGDTLAIFPPVSGG
jgi:molybdopterin converting factor small subunit